MTTCNKNNNNNNSGGCNNLGPIARPRSFSTSNTKAVQPLSLSALLEKNNLLNNNSSAVNNSLGSTIFSATSSSSSLFSGLQEPPSSFSSSIMPSFYGMGNETAIDTMLNRMDDLNLENLEAKLSSLSNSNCNASSVDNHHGSIGALRRGSLLNDCSQPINIPSMYNLIFINWFSTSLF